MSLANRNLKQNITYWAPSGRGPDGEPGFAAPVIIKGRWTVDNQLVTNAKGEEITSKAFVFLVEDVVEEGYLALGDFSTTPSPLTLVEAEQIQGFSSIPDLRYMEQERRAVL